MSGGEKGMFIGKRPSFCLGTKCEACVLKHDVDHKGFICGTRYVNRECGAIKVLQTLRGVLYYYALIPHIYNLSLTPKR